MYIHLRDILEVSPKYIHYVASQGRYMYRSLHVWHVTKTSSAVTCSVNVADADWHAWQLLQEGTCIYMYIRHIQTSALMTTDSGPCRQEDLDCLVTIQSVRYLTWLYSCNESLCMISKRSYSRKLWLQNSITWWHPVISWYLMGSRAAVTTWQVALGRFSKILLKVSESKLK